MPGGPARRNRAVSNGGTGSLLPAPGRRGHDGGVAAPNRSDPAPWNPGGVPLVLAALRIEALAIGGPVAVVGMGPRRAAAAAMVVAGGLAAGRPVVVAGVCGGLDPALRPGTVVVATSVEDAGPSGGPAVALPGAAAMVAALRAAGVDAVGGRLVSTPRVARGADRHRLAAGGATAVDMESAAVVAAIGPRPVAVVRAVADTVTSGMVGGGLRGLRALRGLRPAFDAWAAAGPGGSAGPGRSTGA